MNSRLNQVALVAAMAFASLPAVAGAFSDCPADHVYDGYNCTELKGAGNTGGFFRVTFPSDWDGDLVIVNHGFDLAGAKIRPHEICSNNISLPCEDDTDCPASGAFCNNISYLGLDEVLLPMGKAVAASTYSASGWAVFHSAKDLKDVIKFVKKNKTYGPQLKRVIVTGFSLGGAVTGDATLKLKIDGALPLCAAVGGGLPTWDVAQDVRVVYDFLCDDVLNASFASPPDRGVPNTSDTSNDAIGVGVRVNNCFGILGVGPGTPEQTARFNDFLELTQFSGYQDDAGDAGPSDKALRVASAMGFATLGLGDFVFDKTRLNGKSIGLNDTIDYTSQGTNMALAAEFNAPRTCSVALGKTCSVNTDCTVAEGTCTAGGVKRFAKGKGRAKLAKASWPDFTVGKGKKVDYPILLMAGAADWLVIPEFQRVYDTALTTGEKDFTRTWIDTFGHCVFSEQEVTALFHEYFDWLGPDADHRGPKPSPADVRAACLALPGGAEGDTCNFNDSYTPGYLTDRIPARADWPAAALTHP